MVRMKKWIGICVSQIHDTGNSEMLTLLLQRFGGEEYRTLVFGCFAKMDFRTSFGDGEAKIFNHIPMDKLSALVILGQSILDQELLLQIRDRALEHQVPVITVDYAMENCFNINLDYESTFKRMVIHVIEEHHPKNPFFMAGYAGNDFSDERLEVFKEVLQANGLPVIPEHIAYGDFWEAPAKAACERWMENKEDLPDAIICANDIMALAVYNVLEEHGLRIPEDVIVTGFDGIKLIEYFEPRLTTARADLEEIAAQILKIVRLTGDGGCTPYSVTVPFHLQRGESCGCEIKKASDNFHTSNRFVMDIYNQMTHERLHMNENMKMMTRLTEGHSMMAVLKELQGYMAQITEGNMCLYVNHDFCQYTDIPVSKSFGKDGIMLLMEQKDGEFSNSLKEFTREQMEAGCYIGLDSKKDTLFLPLHWQDEEYGFIVLDYTEQGFSYERLNDFMMMLAQILGTVRKQSQLHEMYIRDALTSLYNRRGFYGEFHQQMEEYADQPKMIFLASVDLDHLKTINDIYGHGEGDVAIKAIGSALEKAIGENGICARFGGDEFVAARIWPKSETPERFPQIFQERLQGQINSWNQENQKEYKLGASTGAILEDITQVSEIDMLMKQSDDNMYDCKDRHHRIRSDIRKI